MARHQLHPHLRASLRRLTVLLLAVLLAGCSSRAGEIAGLGVEGRLVYSQASEGLFEVDFETGAQRRLWEVPEGGMLFGVDVSPDGADIAMAFAPAIPGSAIPRADLYLANGDGSNPQPLLEHSGLYESFDYPVWSPNGQWLYFTRSDVFINEDQTFSDVILNIERIPAGGGQPEVVISNAEQPSISADGSRIAYLNFNLESYTRSLWVANIDGSEAVQVLPDYRFFDVASPRFSPDGQTIAFAGSGQLQPAALNGGRAAQARTSLRAGQIPRGVVSAAPLLDHLRSTATPRTWLDWLLGVQVAYAHGLPWDFWTIPVTGGEPTKLTNWATDGAVLSWSPDGQALALMHLGGLYVRQSGEPVMLAETPLHGGLDWVIDS